MGNRSTGAGAATRLLIVGCGDVGLRVLRRLPANWQVFVLSRSRVAHDTLRAQGATPLLGDLDDPGSLNRLAGLATRVLHLAPPPTLGGEDSRTRALLRALSRRSPPRQLVYVSTTGVYGDAGGARLDETAALRAATTRGLRRVDAEWRLRDFARTQGTRLSILRVPGIYAWGRAGGHPRERLLKGTPVLRREDDVYTNHIHAEDLARACLRALFLGLPQRALNACDDSELLMGDYFDLAADLCGLTRPPRISREQAQAEMTPLQLSFWSESRRLDNSRIKRELRLSLQYPHVTQGLLAGAETA